MQKKNDTRLVSKRMPMGIRSSRDYITHDKMKMKRTKRKKRRNESQQMYNGPFITKRS
jgi:hypothetical protein